MKIPENVKIALDLLGKSGFEAYLVGGCVRDSVRGKKPSDYDITTPSTPEETKAVFRDYPVFLQGEKHGTVGVIINGEKLEITTHRRDGDYLDHRRPESVAFSRAVADDLSRRDFTANALAYSPKFGLVDLFGGVQDIKNKTIRCVGNPDRRFDEDALRILRALRFSSTLGFKIEENTKNSIFKNATLLKTVSAERIRGELEKYICGIRAPMVMHEYKEVFETVLGEINADVFLHHISKLESGKAKMAFLFCCTSFDAITRLKFSNADKQFYEGVFCIYHAMSFSTVYDMKRAVSQLGAETVKTALEIKRAVINPYAERLTEAFEKALANGECMNKKDLKITGADLIASGFEQGTQIGRILDEIFDLVLQDKLPNEHEKLIEYVKGTV